MIAVDDLRRLYRDGRLLLFVGAGVSASVEWNDGRRSYRGPTWDEVVRYAAHELGFTKASLLRARGTDLQILEYFKLNFNGYAKLTNWLVREMNPPDEVLGASVIHQELAKMTSCRLIYTTNFDDFIERSFGLHKRVHKVVAVERHMGPEEGVTEVVKFHGDWNHPTQMVLTESDYEKRMEFTSPMDLRLWSDLLNRTVLFVGYSFRDPNVAYLFRLVKERFAGLADTAGGYRAHIVVEEPFRFERSLFQERNIQVIPIDSGDRTGQVANLLEQIRS